MLRLHVQTNVGSEETRQAPPDPGSSVFGGDGGGPSTESSVHSFLARSKGRVMKQELQSLDGPVSACGQVSTAPWAQLHQKVHVRSTATSLCPREPPSPSGRPAAHAGTLHTELGGPRARR